MSSTRTTGRSLRSSTTTWTSTTRPGTAGLRYAADKGIGVVVMEPLKGGKLAGNLPPEVRRIFDEAPVERTPAEWALRYVWNEPGVSLALSGMNTMEQVVENLDIAGRGVAGSLSAEDVALLDEARRRIRARIKADCTACSYCQPCPAGVEIPRVLASLNAATVWDDAEPVARRLHAGEGRGVAVHRMRPVRGDLPAGAADPRSHEGGRGAVRAADRRARSGPRGAAPCAVTHSCGVSLYPSPTHAPRTRAPDGRRRGRDLSMAVDTRIGEKVATVRESLGLSCEELAERSGCDVAVIERIEAGELVPSLAPLIKISRALGVRLGTLLDDDAQRRARRHARQRGRRRSRASSRSRPAPRAARSTSSRWPPARPRATWSRSSST